MVACYLVRFWHLADIERAHEPYFVCFCDPQSGLRPGAIVRLQTKAHIRDTPPIVWAFRLATRRQVALEQRPVPDWHNQPRKEPALKVLVRENNVDQALRVLKRRLQREGFFRELKRRKAYEKPSERRAREKGEAIRRRRKAARKLAQREGLIATPRLKRPVFGRR